MDSPILQHYLFSINLQHKIERPVYLQLADAILIQIKNGKLLSGQKLPSSRNFALALKINRITITKAYEELKSQGWVESSIGKGTFVSQHIVEHQPKALTAQIAATNLQKAGFVIPTWNYSDIPADLLNTELHLDDGYPDPKLGPLKELSRAYRNQLTRSGLYYKFGSYGNPAGSSYYRETLSGYVNDTRGLKTTAANILSVRGTLMGINLVCNALISPGDIIVSGIPGWKRAEDNFIHAKAQHIGIPVDDHGLVVDELRKVCQNQKVRMVYITAHHHYPTTVSLRIDRRLELLRLSSEYGFIIFEDDYDFDFHYKHRPLLPLASADEKGMVIYCGSFSKSFSPAFRIGYLVASENVINHLTKARILLDRQGDHILDNAIADLLNEGTIQRYARKALPLYEERRDYFCGLLTTHLKEHINFSIPEGGMTVWSKFSNSVNLERLAQKALQKGLLIPDGRAHKYSSFDVNAIRLGFASSSKDELSRSIEIISGILLHQ